MRNAKHVGEGFAGKGTGRLQLVESITGTGSTKKNGQIQQKGFSRLCRNAFVSLKKWLTGILFISWKIRLWLTVSNVLLGKSRITHKDVFLGADCRKNCGRLSDPWGHFCPVPTELHWTVLTWNTTRLQTALRGGVTAVLSRCCRLSVAGLPCLKLSRLSQRVQSERL